MKTALVKIDVAAADLGRSVAHLLELVDGGRPDETGLLWTFNLAVNLSGKRRDLRFWRPELLARTQGEPSKYSRHGIAEVISLILPEKRVSFHAGEIDQLFQMRPRTRIDFRAELSGQLNGGRNTYSRTALESFLNRRWIGAASAGQTMRPAAIISCRREGTVVA